MQKKILLVEDDRGVLLTNKEILEDAGYSVALAETMAEAAQRLSESTPDLIVMDIMLPDGNGVDYCRELRKTRTYTAPILFLTGLGKKSDMIKGLSEGGDDYIAKPYDFDLFLIKVETLLRRVRLDAENAPDVFEYGSLSINRATQRAYLRGNDLILQPKEFAMLLLLTQNENNTLDAGSLYEKAWGQPMGSDKRALRKALSRLRDKLVNSGYTVTPVYGEGYRFEKEQ